MLRYPILTANGPNSIGGLITNTTKILQKFELLKHKANFERVILGRRSRGTTWEVQGG